MALGDVISYDSFDDMLADQKKREDEARSNTTPTQDLITYGSYAVNLSHIEEVGPIYGCIQSLEEVVAWHQLFYGIGDREHAVAVLEERGEFEIPRHTAGEDGFKEDGFATAEEAIQHYVTHTIEQRTYGYIFGNWYSVPFPEGELGSAHVSVCVPISKEIYDDAKAHGWKISMEHAEEIQQTYNKSLAEWREAHPRGAEDDNPDR